MTLWATCRECGRPQTWPDETPERNIRCQDCGALQAEIVRSDTPPVYRTSWLAALALVLGAGGAMMLPLAMVLTYLVDFRRLGFGRSTPAQLAAGAFLCGVAALMLATAAHWRLRHAGPYLRGRAYGHAAGHPHAGTPGGRGRCRVRRRSVCAGALLESADRLTPGPLDDAPWGR